MKSVVTADIKETPALPRDRRDEITSDDRRARGRVAEPRPDAGVAAPAGEQPRGVCAAGSRRGLLEVRILPRPRLRLRPELRC